MMGSLMTQALEALWIQRCPTQELSQVDTRRRALLPVGSELAILWIAGPASVALLAASPSLVGSALNRKRSFDAATTR